MAEPKLVVPPLKKCPFCHGSAEIRYHGLIESGYIINRKVDTLCLRKEAMCAFALCTECQTISKVFVAAELDISEREKDPMDVMQILICKAAYAWNRRA